MGTDLPAIKRITARAMQALLATALGLAAGPVHAADDPVLSAIASAFIPGAGQLRNGDREAAAAHFGIFAVSVYGALRYRQRNDYLHTGQRFDEDGDRELINRTTLRYDYAVRLIIDTQLYSSYAAYRDARARDNSGYRMAAPRESLADLAAAPFSLRYLSRPTTFIPLAIQAVGVSSNSFRYRVDRMRDVSRHNLHTFNFIANEMTAVGEEAMFRGFLNNEFSDRYGDRTGLVMSSVIFGLSHSGTGQTANALQATAAGLYLGWLHQRNGFEAAEGAALHYWINVLAGAAAIRNGGGAELLRIGFSF